MTRPEWKQRADAQLPALVDLWLTAPYQWAAHRLAGSAHTVLDVGGGERRLGKLLMEAVDIEIDPLLGNDWTGSVLDLPFDDQSFEAVTCFEVVEHVGAPLMALGELVRVCSQRLFVGSVNKGGPNFLGRDVLFKGPGNWSHVAEMGTAEFADLFHGLPVTFFSSMLAVFPLPASVVIVPGLQQGALSNLAEVSLP